MRILFVRFLKIRKFERGLRFRNREFRGVLRPGRHLLFDPLLDRLLGVTQIGTQPDRAAVAAELSELINGIPSDGTRPGLANSGANTSQRTADIGKAVCSAVLGSAAMLVQ